MPPCWPRPPFHGLRFTPQIITPQCIRLATFRLRASVSKSWTLRRACPSRPSGDARKNVGAFVQAILSNSDKTIHGKFALAYVEETTAGAMLQTWVRLRTSKPSACKWMRRPSTHCGLCWPKNWSHDAILEECW